MKKTKSYLKYVRAMLPTSLKKIIYRVGMYFGSAPLDIYPSVQASLSTLKNQGFSPSNCIDIGAYKGEWTDIFKSIFPNAKILMVEAQNGKKEELEQVMQKYKGSVILESQLLSARPNEKVVFYEMESGSSVLPELTNHPRSSIELNTQTLDNLTQKHTDFKKLDFLKLDTQGYELEILKGGDDTLKNTKVLLLEVSLIPYNAGGPLIAEVIEYLDKKNFQLFDFCSQFRKADGVLFQTDLLFLNRDSDLLPEPEIKL